MITVVNLLSPYIENTTAITENVDDRVVQPEVANNADPFFYYILLGESASDGLFLWATIGVNPTAFYNYFAGVELTADGRIELSCSTTTSLNSTGVGNGQAPGMVPVPEMAPEWALQLQLELLRGNVLSSDFLYNVDL